MANCTVNLSDEKDDYIVLECPHCSLMMLMYKNEINCQIFRHGVIKELEGKCQIENPSAQIPPHESKENCDKVVDVIYGCGKPFKIEKGLNEFKAVACGYI